MKRWLQIPFVTTLLMMLSATSFLAQQTPPPSQAPLRQADQLKRQPPSQDSDQPAPSSADTAGVQVFTGAIIRQGDKYVLQSAEGTVYAIDHQDEVKKFEGKKVRVYGTLDASGKMIHIQ
jgi:hypothetical protein